MHTWVALKVKCAGGWWEVQVYSLSKSRDYPHHFATATYEVPYYVADAQAFHKNYPPGSRERYAGMPVVFTSSPDMPT